MNTNWAKILLFSLLGFALGFVICCLTCGRCHQGGGCEKGGAQCHGGMSQCEHGGSCCSGEGSHCDKAGCDHKMGAACCKGGHGMHGMKEDGNVQVIVKQLEGSNFQGDTTITIDGGTVNVHRMGDSTTVKVEMHKTEEVTVEHTH